MTGRDTAGPDDELAGRLHSLGPGGLLAVVGGELATLAGHAAAVAPVLRLDLGTARSADAIVGRVLDDLADIALATWPDWPAADAGPWRRAADRLARAGRRPRFTRVPAAIEVAALHPAAGRPTLLFPLDPVRAERAAPAVAALEWARRHGAAVVAHLTEPPPFEPPWDRVLHGAVVLAPAAAEPALARLAPPPAIGPRGSVVERHLRAALRGDAALAGLFEDEVALRLGPLGPRLRVDLLWRAGLVVVEIDGPEHEREPTYAADRHRDYELLVAGYLVLRLTNAEVELDLARSLEKIRRVVALRSGPG